MEMVRRHHLGGDAADPLAATRAVLALHATDPASVYLSILARSASSTLSDVARAMYERRELVRWMAMRRTLFVFAREDVPLVQAAVSTPLAAALRRRLLSRLARNATVPAVTGDAGRWLSRLERRVERELADRESATGRQLADAVPELRTLILPRAPSERPQNVTSPALTMMSAEGRIVRGTPTGAWTSRHHRWEPVSRWWADGLAVTDTPEAQAQLARRWLERFGPATFVDLKWWTGWNKETTRRALTALPVEEVDLDGRPGLVLAGDLGSGSVAHSAGPAAVLLPALDPTPMGWKDRDWFFGIDPAQVFDRAGNIGPTLWWDGEIIGSWAVAPDGDVRVKAIADRGADARHAVEQAASSLHGRLEATVITPAVRTPLEEALATEAADLT